MQWFGIDISRYQGDFNMAKAKSEGVSFVIIKAGGGDDKNVGLYKDSQFENNYSKAKANGIPCGAYFFGNARTIDRAKEEADYFLSLLKGKQFEMPVYYDVEAGMLSVEKNLLTDIVLAFCERVESAGYFTGIYGNPDSFTNHLDDNKLTHFCHWVAYWAKSKPKLKSGVEVGLWQYGGGTNYIRSNIVAGVVCDQDYCYVDYPSAIKSLGLNGFGKPEPEPTPTLDAVEPKMGYGDFNDRVARLQKCLKELGYDVGNDGLYDERVRQAMRKWQESVGLEVTGEYGIADYQKMVVSP